MLCPSTVAQGAPSGGEGRDNAFEPRQMLPLSLSYDHRAIDGSEGAEFLRDVKAFVESPALAL